MAIGQLPFFQPVSISRAECREWVLPCRLTGCRYHLGSKGGEEPCALNRAEAGPMTCDEIAPLMGMSDENVRLIELDSLVKIAPGAIELESCLDDDRIHISPRVLNHMDPDDAASLLDEFDTALTEPEELPPEAELPVVKKLAEPKRPARKTDPNQVEIFYAIPSQSIVPEATT